MRAGNGVGRGGRIVRSGRDAQGIGAASIVAARLLLVQSTSGTGDPLVGSDAGAYALAGLHAFGDFSLGLGAGLTSAAAKRRIKVQPTYAGVTLSGRF